MCEGAACGKVKFLIKGNGSEVTTALGICGKWVCVVMRRSQLWFSLKGNGRMVLSSEGSSV